MEILELASQSMGLCCVFQGQREAEELRLFGNGQPYV